MKRVISVYLPTWPTDRLHHRNATLSRELPLATVDRDGQKRFLASMNDKARQRRLYEGQALAFALALVPDLKVIEADHAADAKGLEQIGLEFLRLYSPIVSITPPNLLWLDVTGCCHLYGGEESLLKDLLKFLNDRQIAARATIADTYGAAYAISRYCKGSWTIVTPGAQHVWLKNLPIIALRLPNKATEDLKRLGFLRIRQLYDVHRAPFVKRFGKVLLERLDQALGKVSEPMNILHAPERPSVRRTFSEPVANPEYVAKVIDSLAESLCKQLEALNVGARRIDLLFHRVDGEVKAIRVGTVSATRQPKHLTRLFAEHLDKIDYGLGIESLHLIASLSENLQAQQFGSLLAGPEDKDISGLIDIYTNRFGSRAFYQVTPVESDVPERCFKRISLSSKQSNTAWPTGRQWPSRMLREPLKLHVTALLPDHAPRRFVLYGKTHTVMKADSLHIVYGEWWKQWQELFATRSYFKVQDSEGGRYLVFRRGDGIDPRTGNLEWFLQGIFS